MSSPSAQIQAFELIAIASCISLLPYWSVPRVKRYKTLIASTDSTNIGDLICTRSVVLGNWGRCWGIFSTVGERSPARLTCVNHLQHRRKRTFIIGLRCLAFSKREAHLVAHFAPWYSRELWVIFIKLFHWWHSVVWRFYRYRTISMTSLRKLLDSRLYYACLCSFYRARLQLVNNN